MGHEGLNSSSFELMSSSCLGGCIVWVEIERIEIGDFKGLGVMSLKHLLFLSLPQIQNLKVRRLLIIHLPNQFHQLHCRTLRMMTWRNS
ncbi:hypothetical protein CsSME_00005428 [Camellia sinensis var. sinensis]